MWQGHITSVGDLAFRPDGRTLVSVGMDNTVKLWDVASGTLLWTGWQTGGIRSLAFSPDGRLLASGGDDTLVQFWDPQSGTKLQTLAGPGGTIYSLAWSPHGRLLARGYSDGDHWGWGPPEARPRTHRPRPSWPTRPVAGP